MAAGNGACWRRERCLLAAGRSGARGSVAAGAEAAPEPSRDERAEPGLLPRRGAPRASRARLLPRGGEQRRPAAEEGGDEKE